MEPTDCGSLLGYPRNSDLAKPKKALFLTALLQIAEFVGTITENTGLTVQSNSVLFYSLQAFFSLK
jgi:hypothetical protein